MGPFNRVLQVLPGQRAPLFVLPNALGQPVALADFLGKQPVVLMFYPKNETPGCTAQACSVRDGWPQLKALGAVVLGVSSDSAESHQRFAARHQLSFPLLSDGDGQLRRLYGVPKTWGLLPGRVTYCIDLEGVVQKRIVSQFNPQVHLQQALLWLKTLKGEPDVE